MRIAFACPPLSGHLLPMTALARKMKQRGHDVVFLGVPDSEPLVRAANLEFIAFGESRCPRGEVARRLRHLSHLTGVAGLEYTVHVLADVCQAALEAGEWAVRDSRAEALVVDPMYGGVDLVATKLQVPFVSVSSALHFDCTGHTPLCVFDWPHEETAEARARNRQGIAFFAGLVSPIREMKQEYARRARLAMAVEAADASVPGLAHITQTPREFDFRSGFHPPTFHYAGPFHDELLRPRIDFPWHKLTGEPLVYASMGTLQNGVERVFRLIADAVEGPGRQLVLSIGKNLRPNDIGAVAESTIVLEEVPQVELLRRATLCITHAGLNTVLESLAQGVPMIAIPITNDQPGVAARIAYTGTGVVIRPELLSADTLRNAIGRVLSRPTYSRNAQDLQRAIRSADGLNAAANLIERTLRTGSSGASEEGRADSPAGLLDAVAKTQKEVPIER